MSKNLVIVLVNVIIECFLHDTNKAEKTSTSQLPYACFRSFHPSYFIHKSVEISQQLITDFTVWVGRRHQIHLQYDIGYM